MRREFHPRGVQNLETKTLQQVNRPNKILNHNNYTRYFHLPLPTPNKPLLEKLISNYSSYFPSSICLCFRTARVIFDRIPNAFFFEIDEASMCLFRSSWIKSPTVIYRVSYNSSFSQFRLPRSLPSGTYFYNRLITKTLYMAFLGSLGVLY
jgi:hypothetical protein